MQLVWRMRYYPAVGPAIPRASVGRSRVTHPFAGHLLRDAHDLHVLSTPPAFVLSQDQTLQEIISIESEIALRTHPVIAAQPESLATRRCVRITDIVGSNSPQYPDRDTGSTSPPRTSAISN